MSILLIRHAETAANAARVVQTPDVPLNERGIEQSSRLARRLAGERIGLILASDYERAAHTARLIASETAAPIEYDAALRERHYGDVRGLPYAEIGADIFAPDYAPPGGETWDEFESRVAGAWSAICARAPGVDGEVAVVTHGLVCRVLGQRHLSLQVGTIPPRGFSNTSLTVIDPSPPFAVRLLNCCAHLDGGAAALAAGGISGI